MTEAAFTIHGSFCILRSSTPTTSNWTKQTPSKHTSKHLEALPGTATTPPDPEMPDSEAGHSTGSTGPQQQSNRLT